MEATDTILTSLMDVSGKFVNHLVYAIFGFLVLAIGLFRLYCRLTLGVCDSKQDMAGKTVLITGATAGVGKATAEDLARRNARVILACRNVEKANRVAKEIMYSTGNPHVRVKHLDLASLASVRKCAESVLATEKKLHVLINNAGILGSDTLTTEDGYETVMQSNHLGHFLLTMLLLDLLKKSAPSRIINVASSAYAYGKLDVKDMEGKNCINEMAFYSRSKLANVLFTTELAARLSNSGITVNALHPGMVKSDIFLTRTTLKLSLVQKIGLPLFAKSCEEGAQTSILLAVDPDLEKTTGKYFSDCKEEKIPPEILDKSLARELFKVSEEMTGATFKSS